MSYFTFSIPIALSTFVKPLLPYPNSGTKQYYYNGERREAPEKHFFHLEWQCIRRVDPTVEMRHIHMNDEVFLDLTAEHFELLMERGFLQHVVRAKKEVLESLVYGRYSGAPPSN